MDFSILENKTIFSVEKIAQNVLCLSMTDGSVFHIYSDEAVIPGLSTMSVELVIAATEENDEE